MYRFLTRQELANIRSTLGFNVDLSLSLAEIEDYKRELKRLADKNASNGGTHG